MNPHSTCSIKSMGDQSWIGIELARDCQRIGKFVPILDQFEWLYDNDGWWSTTDMEDWWPSAC